MGQHSQWQQFTINQLNLRWEYTKSSAHNGTSHFFFIFFKFLKISRNFPINYVVLFVCCCCCCWFWCASVRCFNNDKSLDIIHVNFKDFSSLMFVLFFSDLSSKNYNNKVLNLIVCPLKPCLLNREICSRLV